jgi:hypothetical protein
MHADNTVLYWLVISICHLFATPFLMVQATNTEIMLSNQGNDAAMCHFRSKFKMTYLMESLVKICLGHKLLKDRQK